MKFLIGLPSVDNHAHLEVVASVFNQLSFIFEEHHYIEVKGTSNTLIHNARNQIAQYAIEKEFDYLFFIDSDCAIPNNTLKRLYEHNKDVVSGMYFQKKLPFLPVVYTLNAQGTFDFMADYPANSLVRVGGIGMGICLIKVSALKKMSRGNKFTGFNPLAATTKCKEINGEDLAFCKRCYQYNINLYVDTGIQAGHYAEIAVKEKDFKKAWAMLDGAKQTQLTAQPNAEV